MKYFHIPILLLIIFSPVILSSCKDDAKSDDLPVEEIPVEEPLPVPSREGKGIFGCRVDGRSWIARSNTSYPAVYASFNNNTRQVYVSGNMIDHDIKFHLIGLRFLYKEGVKEYPLFVIRDTLPSASYMDIKNNKVWQTDSLLGGKLVVSTFDSVKHILSGTFYFKCADKNKRILTISDGRFDVVYTN